MKIWKYSLRFLLVAALAFIPLTACANNAEDSAQEGESQSDASTNEGSEEGEGSGFDYSAGIDDKGYWKDVTAKDSVTLKDGYDKPEIPSDVSTIAEEDIQAQVDTYLESYPTVLEITDRAVEDGDSINIDYVGSVDGVEFEGGNTNGGGALVTIGETNFIDDFLQQLIGHTPGETINVEVTFPDEYENNPDLAGKDAVFVTTINFISEEQKAELNDEFVKTNLEADEGWTTVDEMKKGIEDTLRETAVKEYLSTYILDFEVSSVPDSIIEYYKNSMVDYYEQYAGYMGVSIEEFLSSYVGVESMDEFIEQSASDFEDQGKHSLVLQAMAEDKGIEATDEDVLDYFVDEMGTDDYSSYEEQYGMNYLKQVTLDQMVYNILEENAVYE